MDLTVDRKAFRQALGLVGRAISVRSFAVLAGFKLEAGERDLRLTATNLDTTLTTTMPARVATPGVAVSPAKQLGQYCAGATADELRLVVKKQTLEIRADKGRSEIKGFDADDFPTIDLTTTSLLSLPAADLRDAIASVIHAVARDEFRPALAGVHVQVKAGVLYLAAADGSRLASRSLPLEGGADIEAIVPLQAMSELARLLASAAADSIATLGLNGTEGKLPTRAVFTVGPTTLVSRLLEGTFPNWRQIVPTRSEISLSVDRRALLAAVGRARIFADSKDKIVRLEIERASDLLGVIRVIGRGDLGESVDEVSCTLHGEGLQIAFAGHYLDDALGAIGTDAIKLELSSPSRPAVFRPSGHDDHVCVLMPMSVPETRRAVERQAVAQAS